jgi:SAM-dependent methyltransferase
MSPEESHKHSLTTLNHLRNLEDYMANLENICDMGAGIGHDACWFSTLTDLYGRNYNYNVTAVDNSPGAIRTEGKMTWSFDDVHSVKLPQQDLIWCHNTLQYLRSPIEALFHWHTLLREDGLLLIEIPIQNIIINSGVYHNYTLGNLIVQLASAGFDCRGGHFQYDKENGWMRAAVYKVETEPKIYKNWYDLHETNRLPFCLDSVLNANNYFSENDLVLEWIDRSQSFLTL